MVFQGEFGLYFLGGGFYMMFPAKSARFQKTNKKDITCLNPPNRILQETLEKTCVTKSFAKKRNC